MSRSDLETPGPNENADDPGSEQVMRATLRARLADTVRAEHLRTPPSIPDHELLQHIGAGAYGDVWLARSALGTLRAVKIVYRARFEDEHPYEREFQGILKYEPISRTHEGLVQVLHVGRHNETGCFYYVMELADSVQSSAAAPSSYCPRTLRSEIKSRNRLPAAAAAELTIRLAHALQHLHSHGLVHRDIKPSNVIFVDGKPKLADVGLIAGAGDSRSFVGTEGFVPPEGPGATQADIYSLGKLLYELATGCDRLEFPQLPLTVTRSPEGPALLELNEVVTRACAPQPERRYASVIELQADLSLFLAGRSLRRERNIERNVRRLKHTLAASCIVMVVAMAAVGLAKNSEQKSKDRARLESTLRARAEAAEQDARQQLYVALLEQARANVQSLELGQRVRALDAVRRAAAISNTVELRGAAVAALALADLRLEGEFPIATEASITQLDPAFKRAAIIRVAGATEIHSVPDLRLITTLPASTNLPAYVAFWSDNGQFLAVKRDRDPEGHRAELEIWNVDASRRALLLHDSPWAAASFHPHRAQLLAGLGEKSLALWNLDTGEVAAGPIPTPGDIIRVQIAPGGERFAALCKAESGWTISVHDLQDGALRFTQKFSTYINDLDWHPSGRFLAMVDADGGVSLMDAKSGARRSLGRHKANAVTVLFSGDGGHLITGGWERELICWDLATMQRAFTIRANSFRAQFSGDGHRCALLTLGGVQIHTLERPTQRQFQDSVGGRLRDAAFSPDARWLAVSGDARLGVWDLNTIAPAALVAEGANARTFFSTTNEIVAGRNISCFRWHVETGSNVTSPPQLKAIDTVKDRWVKSVCVFSNQLVFTGQNGTRMVAAGEANSMEGEWIATADGLNGVSPDERWFGIYSSFTPVLNIYRLPELQSVTQLWHQASINGFKFSPRGTDVAAYSQQYVTLWSMKTWQRTRSLTNYSGIFYSPDAPTCWLTRENRTTQLFDEQTLTPLLPLPNGTVPLSLSHDGRWMAASHDGQYLQLWDLNELRKRLQELGLDWVQP